MHIDQVDVVDVQSFHTLIHTVGNALRGVIPEVHPILAVAPHLGGEVVLVTRNILQCLAQNRFGLQMTVIRRHVNEVDSVLNGGMYGLNAFRLANLVEHTTQRGSTESQIRQLHPRLSQFIVYHILYF